MTKQFKATLADISRVEVIDHRKDGEGRAFVAWNVQAKLEFQDDGRTLKIFVTERNDE